MDKSTERELVSAQHDGECTPAESEAAQRLLEHSEAAQCERDQCAEISQLLGQLPREEAPAGFGSRVLLSVERDMLLGEPELAPAMPVSKSLTGLPRWAYLVAGVAAGILAVVGWSGLVDSWQRPRSDSGGALSLAQRDADVALSSKLPAAGSELAQTEFSQSQRNLPYAHEGAFQPDGDFADGALGNGPLVAEKSSEKSAIIGHIAPVAQMAETGLEVDGQPRFRFLRQLNAAQVGEVVEALKVSENDVSVVKLTVVDRWKSLAQLRVVLSENASETEDAQSLDRRQVDQQHLLVGVFIEASDAELASALREIQKIDNVQELSVAQSVSLADVSRNMIAARSGVNGRQRRVDVAESAGLEGAPAPAAPSSSKKKSKPDTSTAKRAFAVGKPGAKGAAATVAESAFFGRSAQKLAVLTRQPIMFKSSLLTRQEHRVRKRPVEPVPQADDSAGFPAKFDEQHKVVVLFVLVAENKQQGIDKQRIDKGRQQKPAECSVDDSA